MNTKTKLIGKRILLILVVIVLISINRNVLIYRPLLSFIPIKTTYGTIIEKKDMLRRGYITGSFNYYYEFTVNNKVYTNPSYDEKYRIGDTILIEYNEMFPFINRIKGQQ